MQQTGVTVVRHCAAWEPAFPLSRREIEPVSRCILAALGLEHAHFTLKLVSDAAIAQLNSEFMGCTGPTNVLSFPAEDSDSPEVPVHDGESGAHLGEIALSVDTLARETRLYGQSPVEHLTRLLSHAVLHLAGFDHGEPMEALTTAAVNACSDRR